MFELRAAAATGLDFADLDGQVFTLDLAALVSLSEEGRDPRSGQRRPDVALAPGETLADAQAQAGGWRVHLSSGRGLTLSQARLTDYRDPHLWRVQPRPWNGADVAGRPVYDYAAFLGDDDTRRRALLQMAAYGFVRLTRAPARPGEIETAVGAFGIVRETNYGRLFDVKTKLTVANLADTALALAPHTDNPYRLAPPEIQVLHCLTAAGQGGQSLLVDGLAVVEALKAEAPADYDLLSRVPARFAWNDGETFLEACAPVIAADRIRYNPRSFQAVCSDDADVRAAWLAAFDRLGQRFESPAAAVAFNMAAGDMVLMDNRRVLHGRTAFDATGDIVRHLQGGYADMDGVYSTLRRLTEADVAAELDALEHLFENEALSEFYGEDISIRDHMLQAAEGALKLGKGAEIVAAALLHDIGWGMEGPHETAAVAVVAPRLGDRVASLIRRHVDAKRYLVATRSDYFAKLSQASVETLGRQGGPMGAEDCRAFEALPDFDLCLELRYLDEAGKTMTAPVTRFADYRPLLKTLMIRNRLKG